MDIGLVCDQCDTFSPMTAQTCSACGAGLSLGDGRRKGASSGGAFRGMTPTPVPQPAPQPPPAAAQAPAAQGRGGGSRTMFFGQMQAAKARLVLIRGDGADGLTYTLAGQDHLAGRLEGALVFGEDPFLSPRHSNFFYKNGKLVVADLQSANGVFVRIRTATPIKSADTVLVGEQLMRVEVTPPETAGLGPDPDGTYFYASPRRAARMRLIQLLRGGDIGLIHRVVGDTVTMGREGNDINFPDDPFISGRHAQVQWTESGLVLTDLGSKNGTFLRVSGEATLVHGDYVFMGQQLLRVEIV